MAWAFDVTAGIPRITQSGTDSGLGGIATAITALPRVTVSTAYNTAAMRKPPVDNGMWYRCSVAGTTAATAPTYNPVAGSTTTDGTAQFVAFLAPDVRPLGTANHYYMPVFRFNVTGQLTNANIQQQNFTCWDIICSATNATFTSGQWAADGVTPLYDGLHFCATRVGANGPDDSSGGFQLQLNSQCTFIGGEVQVAGAVGFATNSTPRSYQTRWRNTKDWGGVTSSRFRSNSTTAIFRDCEFFDMAFDLFRMPAEFSVKARGSEYLAQYVGAAYGGADAKFTASNLENVDGVYEFDNFGSGWVELYNCKQGADLRVVSQNTGTPATLARHCVPLYQDIVITAKDTSGAAVQDVRFTATETPTNSPTITITTTGNLKTWDFRTPLSYQTTTNASGVALSSPVLNVWYWQTTFKQSLRFPSSTATYQGRAYNFKTVNVPILLGASTAVQASAGMISLDTATIMTEAAALAQTKFTFTPSGTTGGNVTATASYNANELWDAYRAWISAFANRPSNDTWTAIAGKLTMGAWTLTHNTGVTGVEGSTLNFIKATAITLNGTAKLEMLYESSAGPNTIFEFQDLITDNSSAVIITDVATGTVKLYQRNPATSSLRLYIAPGTTGTYRFRVYHYGSKPETGTFAANAGGFIYYVPDYAEDIGITQPTLATVEGYSKLDDLDKYYDYLGAFQLTAAGAALGPIGERDGTAIRSGNLSGKLNHNPPGGALLSVSGSLITVKTNVMNKTPKFTTLIADPPATWTAHTNEIFDCEIEDGNGDSSLTISAASVSTFELWKIADSVPEDDYATGTLLATVGIGKWRFLHADGFKIVVRDQVTGYRVPVEMEKGIYPAELFFGPSVQLAQAALVEANNELLQLVRIDLEDIKGTGFQKDVHSLTIIAKMKKLIGLIPYLLIKK